MQSSRTKHPNKYGDFLDCGIVYGAELVPVTGLFIKNRSCSIKDRVIVTWGHYT